VWIQQFPISNDAFATATVIGALPFSDVVDISAASMEAGEPTSSCSGGASSQRTVWYAFTPAVTAVVTASVAAQFSTVVGVYSGGLGSLAEITCRSPFVVRDATFLAQAGTTYHIQVDGMFGQIGVVELHLEVLPPPPNDLFVNATAIGALPFSGTVDLTAASTEGGEPSPSCAAPFGGVSSSAWYHFTPTVTGSISANAFSGGFSNVVAAYTGSSVTGLTEVACGVFGNRATFRAVANTTYYFQVSGLFGQRGPLEFRLDVTPPPVANFFFFPFDASVFDVVQFVDQSFDPGGVGFAPPAWTFGDGTTGTGNPTHRFAADGDYSVQLTVTTLDGRTAVASQTVHVRTHDVAITRLSVPQTARSGQTKRLEVSINSRRYAETVEVQLFRSVPGGFQQFGSLTQSVPMNPKNGTTDFAFSYTFTADDAQIGKVTFRAFAVISGARDALPADNEAIGPPTKVSR
jgi:PKD repeat protein